MQKICSTIFGRTLSSFNNICWELKNLRNSVSVVRYSTKMTESEYFKGKEDLHQGISVDSLEEPCSDINSFTEKLAISLKKWTEEKVHGVWFHVDLMDAQWIPVLAKNGFKVHRGFGDKVTLVKWLPEDMENRIPQFSHTMIGGGGIVLNDNNQILVVRESYKTTQFWKLPGGYVERGETLIEGVQREVLEETNIKTEFVSIVAFRHSSVANFDSADIYFIVEFKALSSDIVKEDVEILAAQWMEIDEYLNHPLVHENNRFIMRKYLEAKKNKVMIKGDCLIHPISKKPQTLFSIALRDASS